MKLYLIPQNSVDCYYLEADPQYFLIWYNALNIEYKIDFYKKNLCGTIEYLKSIPFERRFFHPKIANLTLHQNPYYQEHTLAVYYRLFDYYQKYSPKKQITVPQLLTHPCPEIRKFIRDLLNNEL